MLSKTTFFSSMEEYKVNICMSYDLHFYHTTDAEARTKRQPSCHFFFLNGTSCYCSYIALLDPLGGSSQARERLRAMAVRVRGSATPLLTVQCHSWLCAVHGVRLLRLPRVPVGDPGPAARRGLRRPQHRQHGPTLRQGTRARARLVVLAACRRRWPASSSARDRSRSACRPGTPASGPPSSMPSARSRWRSSWSSATAAAVGSRRSSRSRMASPTSCKKSV